MTPKTRPISWIKAALSEFQAFPEEAQSVCLVALTVAAEGGKADIAKRMQGMGPRVFEIALRLRGDAFRGCLRRAAWNGNLGDPCLPEEIEAGHQNAQA
jgi:phage-related protein